MAERQFGPYRLVRQIAVGGMAEIHLAKTRGIAGFEKYVALKMIHPNFASDEQFIEMLIDEAKIAVQLQHVNIAQTFDLGRVGETYYITMEFVDGADLYKILRRGSEQDLDVPLDVCAFVAKEMATGLDYAHRKRGVGGEPLGIVHRDVSPQNVLVSHAGEVKLVDFGIAKATMKARQTAVGVIKGKYYYMSPEQAWGDRLDHRSDIFSAGIVLYEMITGQMLYLEEDLHKLLEMVRRAAIAPPSRLRARIPPQLERIVMHALAKKAEDRYQNAGDMAADLERFLHTYSPVFTASKLAAHLRRVLGDPFVPAPPPPEPVPELAPRDPRLSTQPIEEGELLRERSELQDENSVIFRIAELQGRQRGDPGDPDHARVEPRDPDDGTRPLRAPDVARRSGERGATAPVRWSTEDEPAPPARFVPSATMNLSDGDLSELDVEEMTVVSGPPGFEPPAPFGGKARPATRATAWDLAEDSSSELEPTMIEQAPRGLAPPRPPSGVDDEGPTIARDARREVRRDPRPPREADEPTRETPASRVDEPTRGHAEPGRGRARGPAHPALSARTPTPAVSELRRPRASRRTPAGGTPAQQASVLQAIVGAHQSEPMPTRPVRGAGAPSDGVPARLPEDVSASAPTEPIGGRGGGIPTPLLTTPMPTPPVMVSSGPIMAPPQQPPQPHDRPSSQLGYNALPQPPETHPDAQLPPHLQPYGLPHAAQTIAPDVPFPSSPHNDAIPGAMPLGAPLDTPLPLQAYQPVSFTKQLAALEVDEIPPHLRLSQGRANWLLRSLLAAVIVVGGVAAGMFVLRESDRAMPSASLLIESVPPGATVTIDGARLSDPTPVPFASTGPGARHEIRVDLARHRPWSQTVVVPRRGGEVRVMAFLSLNTVRLRITSVPAGAEVHLNGQLRGYTPTVLTELDPDTTKSVELRLKDYAPEIRVLDWSRSTEADLEVRLHK
jgi:serine/threonine protein kinase